MTTSPQFLSAPIAPFIPSNVFYDIPSDGSAYSNDDEESDEELFDGEAVFSVEQDVFLVQQCCFYPETRAADLASKFEREFGISRDGHVLDDRLQKLESPEFRALLALYLKAVTHSKGGGHVTLGALPKYQPLLDCTRTTCEARLFQLIYEDEKLRHEACEFVTLEVAGRTFPKYSRIVPKAELRRCCKTIDDLYQGTSTGAGAVSSHQCFSLHNVDTKNERIHLTDTVSYYDSVSAFNHLEQPIVDRLILFAKDPNIMERLTLQRQQQQEAAHIKRKSVQDIHAIFEKQRQTHLARLELARSDALSQIRMHLEKALEDDIQHLRRMHTQLLNHEVAKVNAKYDELEISASDRVRSMQRDVFALQKNCESSGWHGLEQSIMGTTLQVEKLFGTSDLLLRLLILAEDLDAEPLRQALVRYLSDSNRLPQFALRREMTSKLIADSTVLAMLKNTSIADLREVESYGNSFLHHNLVTRELHTRKVELGRFLAGLTNSQLRGARRISIPTRSPVARAKTASDLEEETAYPPDLSTAEKGGDELKGFAESIIEFPDVLDQEFARRRDFSCVKMSSFGVERDVSFSEEDCVLQLETSQRYCTVPATKVRRQGESGKWMFEVTVEVFGGDGESLFIGWEVPRDQKDTSHAAQEPNAPSSPSSRKSFSHAATMPSTLVPGLSPGVDGRSFGVTWQSDGGLEMGMLHANGQSRSGVPCFRAGDVIGCTIDQDHAAPHLRFYLNGDLALPARVSAAAAGHSLAGVAKAAQAAGIAVLNPAYCLVPVVSMYSARRKPQMRVRFNFRGDFRFPVEGFDPFGAPI